MATAAKQNAGTREVKKTKAQILKERRKIRNDLGSMRNVMQTPEVPGLFFRWVNNEVKSGRNRIEMLRSLGWEVYDGDQVEIATPNNVTEANISLGKGSEIAVGVNQAGQTQTAVLMFISKDVYDADQLIKEEAILEKEEGIVNQGEGDAGAYGGINIG